MLVFQAPSGCVGLMQVVQAPWGCVGLMQNHSRLVDQIARKIQKRKYILAGGLLRRPASIDCNSLSCDEASAVGTEKYNGFCDLFRTSQAADRLASLQH